MWHLLFSSLAKKTSLWMYEFILEDFLTSIWINEISKKYSFIESKSWINKNFTLFWLKIPTFHRHLTDVLDTTLSTLLNGTSNPPTADTNKKGFILPAILVITCLIILIGLFITIIAWKKRRRKRSGYQHKGCKFLIWLQNWAKFTSKCAYIGESFCSFVLMYTSTYTVTQST